MGHDYNAVVTPPTTQEGGYTTYTCTLCGHSYKDDFTEIITFTVAGNVTSFGSNTDEITIELVKAGEAEASYTAVVTGNSTEYSFEGVKEGTYTLYVSKKNHVTRTYDVTVTDENVELDLKIHLIGDITGEGIVNAIDVSYANGHSKGVRGLSGYELLCAEVTGDEYVNAIDVSYINGHSKGVRTLWSE
ncbi:MAG: dockerin type I repeat-containing protein [Clostridia bacterium]|nr:dockerin type I repeat-containing protein [Clostridia bacterium]